MNQPSNPLLNQQPQYHQPQQFGQQQAPVMTIGDWIVTSIVLAIPLVNLIMAFVWGLCWLRLRATTFFTMTLCVNKVAISVIRFGTAIV